MHPIDEAIRTGTLTKALLDEHTAKPLPPEGHSYWGDCMRDHHNDPVESAKAAALQMGQTLGSLESVTRRVA